MARFYDKVGYSQPGKLVGGVWSDNIILERDHYMEVLSAAVSNDPSDKVNDDIRIQHRVSFIADAFAAENFPMVKYVKWKGTLWKVVSASIEYPRVILSLGGVYDGPRPTP